MTIMNIIFLITMYPILFIMYFMMRGAGNPDKPYCFGATLKRELREDEKVKAIVTSYKKGLKASAVILALVPIPCFLIPYFSISMSIWLVWVMVVCFLPSALFGWANVKIKELKREKGWNEEFQIRYTDLTSAVIAKKISMKDFLPSLILSTVPVVVAIFLFRGKHAGLFVGMVTVFAVCTLLYFLCAIWSNRQRVPVICCDSTTNINYARAKKQVWKNLWMYSAWTNTVFTWFMLFFMWQRRWAMIGIIIGSVIYCAVLIVICVKALNKLRNIDKIYADKKTLTDAAEDDKNWIFGQIYYNKNDKHYMVECRMGTGTTVNLANKAGKITTIAGVFAVLIIPIMCIWTIMVEFTPIQVRVENNTIICEHLKVKYEIPFSEIASYTTIEELPEMTKLKGTGMSNLYSGTFEVWREGSFETFLNPQNELFIRLVMEDGDVYYISGAEDVDTEGLLKYMEQYIENADK